MPGMKMRSNKRTGVGGVVAIGFAMLPLIVMVWASYVTGLAAFA